VAAIVAADNVEECVAEATELTEVAISIGDRELTMHGHLHRATDLAMLGRRAEADAALDAAASVAAELGQPVQLWQVRAAAATVALGTGRLAEAEALIPAALALGEHSQPEMAIPVFRMQRYVLYDLRGDPAGVADEIRELVAEYPARPVFRCALAQLEARLGREADARRELESFADGGFAALPFDHEWLYGMSLLTDTAAILGDAGAAAALYDMLVPWDRLIAADHPEGMRGSVARYLGMLASMLGRSDEAERHFEDAVAVNARIGALPWLAYTQDDFARMLAARGRDGDAARAQALRDEALAGYAAIGMAPRI
jgi:tetratricopeptide (TPR) repeat protein